MRRDLYVISLVLPDYFLPVSHLERRIRFKLSKRARSSTCETNEPRDCKLKVCALRAVMTLCHPLSPRSNESRPAFLLILVAVQRENGVLSRILSFFEFIRKQLLGRIRCASRQDGARVVWYVFGVRPRKSETKRNLGGREGKGWRNLDSAEFPCPPPGDDETMQSGRGTPVKTADAKRKLDHRVPYPISSHR